MTATTRSDPLTLLTSHSHHVEQQLGIPPPYTKPAPPYSSPDSDPTASADNALSLTATSTAEDIEAPPDYDVLDPCARHFHVRAPGLVYAYSAGSDIPHYQINTIYNLYDRPQQLLIRRLMVKESRRLSQQTTSQSSSSGDSAPRPAYPAWDHNATMYTATIYSGSGLEIRGHRASTLPGRIKLQRSMRGTCRFWHYTRNLAANALDPANEARMLKYGYHADSEWNRELLFAAKKNLFGRRKENVEWRDGDGRVVAAEVGDGLKLVETMGRKRRDVLITCWAVRKWVLGTLAERE